MENKIKLTKNMETKKVRELTDEQKKKCDKIIKLLAELRKESVFPLVIDGGGGDGLSFIRAKKQDMREIGEEILKSPYSYEDEIYKPKNSCLYTIDYLVP